MSTGRPLVLGATGQLGSAVCRTIESARPVGRRDLDLQHATAAELARFIRQHAPDVVINCAAFTAVDAAETDRATAFAVNAVAVGRLAEVTAEADIPFVTFSTDYVFGGDADRPYVEDDPVDPINVYGESKAAGEQLALAANPRTLVVRTSWVVSGTHRNFVSTMLRLAETRNEIRVVDDQRGCPTVAVDLARGTRSLLQADATGVVHMTNTGATTWFELARTVVDLSPWSPDVVPCSSGEFPTVARRPANSVLATDRLATLGVQPLPPWRESIPMVVAELIAEPPG